MAVGTSLRNYGYSFNLDCAAGMAVRLEKYSATFKSEQLCDLRISIEKWCCQCCRNYFQAALADNCTFLVYYTSGLYIYETQ